MKKLILIFALFLVTITALFIYTITHELGHVIIIKILGGDVENMTFFPIPHIVTYTKYEYVLEVVAVSVAGLIFPLLLSLLLALFPKGKGTYRLWVTFYQSLVSLSFLVSTIICLFYPTVIVDNDDITKFLDTTGWNVYLVAAACALIFILNTRIIFLLRPFHTFQNMLGHVHE